MAFTTLKFADREIYADAYGGSYEGSINYNDDGGYDPTLRVSDYIEFSLSQSNSFRDKTLFTYKDGKKIIMNYKFFYDIVNYVYKLTYTFRLVDKNGTLIDWPSTLAHNNPTQEVTLSLSWTGESPDEVFPWSECYYIPSFISYFSSGVRTVVNDEAIYFYACGQFVYKKPRPPIAGGDYTELRGEHKTSELNRSYEIRPVNIVNISSDAAHDIYFGVIDPNNEWHEGGQKPIPPDPSGPGGGDRPQDDDGDPVDFPTLPTVSVINTGLLSLFNPDATQLRSLAGVLWGNDFEQSIKKVLNDPFDGLIGLSMIPFTPSTSGSISCEIGNFDTEISMPLVNAQYYTLDCGQVTIAENWGNALDYNATSAEIFVPFVGFCHLDIQDVMSRTLQLHYNVDILTGAAIAILKCGNKCLYEWPCNLAYDIPLTGSNKAALYTGLINVAMSGLGGLAVGGAMGAVGGAANSALNVATHAQSNVQRGGSLASNTGVLGELLPYIVLHRPKQSMPNNFKNIKGYQSNITAVLGSCHGYTEVDYIHLNAIDMATDTELQEIEQLLMNGVII